MKNFDYGNISDDLSKFLKSIPSDMKAGQHYEWICPICGGKAHGSRAKSNGHLHASCNDCGIGISQ